MQKLIIIAAMCSYISITSSFPVNLCEQQQITNLSGRVHLQNLLEDVLNCTWHITPPPRYITTFHIIDVDVGRCNEDNKLTITWPNGSYDLCEESTVPSLISLRQPYFNISIQSDQNIVKVWFEFKTRSYTQCPNHNFQCVDERKCFNQENRCDGIFDCDDHSDEVSCGFCTRDLVPCSNMTFQCFSPETQRCNGVIDCVQGEDEHGCTPNCNTSISCRNQNKCIHKIDLCDGKDDCKDSMDEENCKRLYCKFRNLSPEYNRKCDEYGSFDTLKSIVASVLTAVIALSIIFGALIWRWYHSRRDIEGLIADMPEFPLPPFEGPGEDRSESGNEIFSQQDFALGGEIYEAYAQTRRRISSETHAKSKKSLHLPMSAPSTKSNSPDLVRNRSAASLIGGPCLSRDKTIENVVEDFYNDDFPITVKYINEAFSDDKSQKDNDDGSKKFGGFKRLFQKKRVRSAESCDKNRDECDFSIFSANQNQNQSQNQNR